MVTGAVWFSLNGTGKTSADIFIMTPAKNCAFWGSFLIGLLTIMQFHRDFRNNTDDIIMTSTDPIHHQVRKTLALVFISIATTLFTSLFTLPNGLVKAGDYFQSATYLTAWFLIFPGALIYTVLLTSGFYMITRRMGVTFIIMTGLILLSKLLEGMGTLNPGYLFYWVQTTAVNFSDLITNQFQIDMILWNRLFCLLVSLGIWVMGLCSFRRYGLGLYRSFFVNCRRLWTPLFLITAISLSIVGYVFEPIFDNSKPIDYSGMIDSGTGYVTYIITGPAAGNPDLTLMEKMFDLDVDTKKRRLSGAVECRLDNVSGKSQILPLQTNTKITIDKVLINGIESKAIRGETVEQSTVNWSIQLPAAEAYDIIICYSGRIRNNNTIVQKASNGISEGYVSIPPNGVSPDFDINVSDKCAFHGTIALDKKLEPVFFYGKSAKKDTRNGKTEWEYTGVTGTQGINMYAAGYITRTFEAGGLTVELKYFAKHNKSILEMNAINVLKAAIDYFTEVYGPLPSRDRFIVLELPAYESGGFAGGNISAMSETCLNMKEYLPTVSSDPHSDSGIDVLVHEIAHQWWGITAIPIPDDTSCWSPEGITCYSTYSFLKHYFGEEYAREHFVKEWQRDWDTYKNAFYIRNPEHLAKLSEEDKSNIMGSFLRMRQYSIMSLMMLKGEELIGSEAFHQKLSGLYTSNMGEFISYDDFLAGIGLSKEVLELE